MAAAGSAAAPLGPTAAADDANDPPAPATAEAAAEPSCRVCWEEADGEDGGMLLTPCDCQGTLRNVHQRCLQQWMQHAPPDTRMLCGVCRTYFVLPPDFEVPPTDYNSRQLQQQVWHDVEQAFGEAQHQEQRLRARQPWPLGLALLWGGAAAAMLAAPLLSVWLANRYHAQQVEQWWQRKREEWRRQAEEERRRRAAARRRYQQLVREEFIPKLEEERAQLERWLGALRTFQRLDRWLPPPLVPGQGQRERQHIEKRVGDLEIRLAGNAFLLGMYTRRSAADISGIFDDDVASSSDSGSDSGSEDGLVNEHRTAYSRPGREHGGQQGGRHNLAAPLLRAVHGLLRTLRQQ